MYKKFTELLFRRDSYVFSNYILKMKLTIILMAIMFFQVKAEIFAQKISVVANKASLSEVIAQIRTQTDYDFLYNNQTLQDAKLITMNVKNLDFKKVLEMCFKDQPFGYVIHNKTVLIVDKPAEKPVQVANEVQKQTVSGVVQDSATGELLIGATVGIEGTTIGTLTNVQGAFTLDAPASTSVLVVSYVGYQSQKIVVGNQTNITVKLVKIETKLEDVVVVGYGTRAKGAVTGAISTVRSDVFENRPVNNTFEALQGAAPGVTITRGSGQPGNQGYNLQVRGYSSINGNVPLVLIDGVQGELGTLNPSDIQDITFLKDAAAAIYGARAADGVVIVTTKKGKKGNGKPEVGYTLNFGIKQPNYMKKMMNTQEFAEFQSEGLTNVGIAGFSQSVFDNIKADAAPNLTTGWNYGLTNYPGFYGYTDWNKAIYKNSSQQIHSLSVSGAGENSNYLISMGYNRDNGTLRFGQNYADRFNLRLNYDYKLAKNLSFQTRTSVENTLTKTPTMLGNALQNVVRQFAYQPVYNQTGQFYGYQGYENPAQSLTEGGLQTNYFTRISPNFKLDFTPVEGLTITGQAAVRLDNSNANSTSPTFTRYNYVGGVQDIRNTPNQATYSNGRTLYRLYQVYADYNKRFGQDHQFNLTAGSSLEQTDTQGQSTTGYNFPGNQIFTLNLADRTNVAYANFTGNVSSQALNSYFGRFSYTFKNKLTVDITGRADGSSKFAADKRWSAVFPSAAVAYTLSEESFIKKMNFFDLLKLRVSWGKMGNQDISSLGLFDYIPLISIGGVYPIGSPNAGLPGAVANTASATRTWETVENKNIGINAEILKSRLAFSFDYYNKINDDMLVAIAVPATFGGTPPSSNQGKLVTKGFDAALTWKDQIKDFRYSVSLLLSNSNNTLVELKNTDNYQEGLNNYRKGYSISSYFGYVYNGIIKTQAQLDDYKKLQGVPSRIAIGDAMYKDVDGDGKLTAFGDKSQGLPGDMVYLGNALPHYTYSTNINLGYKRFDLSVFIQGVGKRDIQYGGNIATPNVYFWPSLEYYYGKTWLPSRPDAPFPRYVMGSVGYDDLRSYDYHTSSLTMQNAAYLRFKVITLAYNLPTVVANKMKMKSARIYFSGQDLFTISKGTLGGNFDPEDGTRAEGTYPLNKVYSLGLDVRF